jgi:hypothetical protein
VAGFLEARATAGLALHAAGESDPENGPTGWAPFTFAVTVPFVTTDFTGVCADPSVSATMLYGLDLDFVASPVPFYAYTAVPVEGGALVGPEALPGSWGNCGWPEWALYDSGGAELWRWSDAYAADCSEVTELEAGLEIRDDDTLPADALAPAGVFTAEMNFGRVAESVGHLYIVRTEIAAQEMPWDGIR